MIHMTSTYTQWYLREPAQASAYVATCRCGWVSRSAETRWDARRLGDAHLLEANA